MFPKRRIAAEFFANFSLRYEAMGRLLPAFAQKKASKRKYAASLVGDWIYRLYLKLDAESLNLYRAFTFLFSKVRSAAYIRHYCQG